MRKSLVLLVDDVPDNLRIVGTILREDYLEIAAATNGAEALDFARKEAPDLILLDVMLPDMDGFEVCRRLKKSPETAGIPIIFLTARTASEDIVRGFDAGGVDYVVKPFRSAELKARVRTHLELHRLKGLLSVCSYCSRICEDSGRWTRLENYVSSRSQARFSHGVCPDCMSRLFADLGIPGDAPPQT